MKKKAKEGLDHAVRVIEEQIAFGIKPVLALKMAGIKNMMDTYYFMEYLIQTNNYRLWKLLKN